MQHYLPLTLNKMQRRYWSLQEDQTLKNIVNSMSELNWTLVSHKMRVFNLEYTRNAKQCRQRWINKLTRSVSDDRPWSSNQDRIILQQYLNHHNSEKNIWIFISEKVNKELNQHNSTVLRNPNGIKNRFYSLIRKGLRRINNELGRPIMPQQIRLLKPNITSKLFEMMPKNECHQFLEIVYNMSIDFPELSVYSQQMDKGKLQKTLAVVMEMSRKEEKNEKKRKCEVELKKRKSSLSTIEEQKLQKLQKLKETNCANCSTNENNSKNELIKIEYDMIDIYFRDIVEDQMSVQFDEVDFRIQRV